jgi:isoamylase
VTHDPRSARSDPHATTTAPGRGEPGTDIDSALGANPKVGELGWRWTRSEGAPFPQGATRLPGDRAYNFALYSKHATRVWLLLFREGKPVEPVLRRELHHLKHKTGRIWHCRVSDDELQGARFYAWSVEGPEGPQSSQWHSFDQDKVLLDPYARAIWFPPDFDRSATVRPGSNTGRAPLGCLRTWSPSPERRPPGVTRHETDAVIYELHVRGFTMHPSSGVRPDLRGTFLGLAEKIPYLKELGVTVVELMPVFQYDPQEGNYWGYMPLSFFAPHDGYARSREPEERPAEFRSMVDAFHDAGIEVVLDVVYNHTAEGDHGGPVYNLKGIDNSTYYLMTGDPARPYADFSGTGNTLHTANRYVRKLVLDSLRYWALEMAVDGFRFDLASAFTRRSDGSIDPRDPGIFGDILSDPDLARLRLIAEPWDAAGAYHLGRCLPGITWLQWNGRFRDDIRRWVRGDGGMVPALMRRLYGSDDLFPDELLHTYRPYQSVNYVTSHDGFTLYDLVSYNEKRNWANGHDNRDGPAEEFNWNCGWEGDLHVPGEVLELRKRQAKNFCALLLLANGTPMIRAGDEFLHTQGGNSNPYNQDNATSWLDWDRLEENRGIFRFFRLMLAFRRSHPTLARGRFWRDDVRWYGPGGAPDLSPASRSLAVFVSGATQGDDDLYLMVNGGPEAVRFAVQEESDAQWLRVIDTARGSPDDFREPGREAALESTEYAVEGRSLVLLRRRGAS